jgi:hypothetical protein
VSAGATAGAPWFRRVPTRWRVIAAAVFVGIFIADEVPGVLGHVLALLVWAGAAWSCLRPARSCVKSAARTWARAGVALFACATLYAASLAVVAGVQSLGNYCLYSGDSNEWGTIGVLAAPQPNATQSSCDALGSSVQAAFQNSQSGVYEWLITSDRPATLSYDQEQNLSTFGLGTDWLIYSGTISLDEIRHLRLAACLYQIAGVVSHISCRICVAHQSNGSQGPLPFIRYHLAGSGRSSPAGWGLIGKNDMVDS